METKSRRGGYRPGGGRPKGSPTRKFAEQLASAARATATAEQILLATGKEPFEGDAHALLVWAYKNPDLPAAMRLQAATAAAPFEKPRLNSVNATVDQHTTHSLAESYRTQLFSELDTLIAAAEAEEGGDGVETTRGIVNRGTTH